MLPHFLPLAVEIVQEKDLLICVTAQNLTAAAFRDSSAKLVSIPPFHFTQQGTGDK